MAIPNPKMKTSHVSLARESNFLENLDMDMDSEIPAKNLEEIELDLDLEPLSPCQILFLELAQAWLDQHARELLLGQLNNPKPKRPYAKRNNNWGSGEKVNWNGDFPPGS